MQKVNDERFKNALTAIRQGKYTIEKMYKNFLLTERQKRELNNLRGELEDIKKQVQAKPKRVRETDPEKQTIEEWLEDYDSYIPEEDPDNPLYKGNKGI